jgi:hypothetical protein
MVRCHCCPDVLGDPMKGIIAVLTSADGLERKVYRSDKPWVIVTVLFRPCWLEPYVTESMHTINGKRRYQIAEQLGPRTWRYVEMVP